MSNLRLLATSLAPDIALAASFLLAWLAPDFPGAPTADDCRTIMILQGVSLLAAVLVGGYRQAALVFLPLVLGGCLLWLLATGTAGLSWAWGSFVWYVVGAFTEGLRAHRGEFGLASENPAHPHRRYDRLVLLYLATATLFPAYWLLGGPARWAIWGTIYFSLAAAVETVLRDQFDRVPRDSPRDETAGPQPARGGPSRPLPRLRVRPTRRPRQSGSHDPLPAVAHGPKVPGAPPNAGPGLRRLPPPVISRGALAPGSNPHPTRRQPDASAFRQLETSRLRSAHQPRGASPRFEPAPHPSVNWTLARSG
jgi:hypothetical protein